MRGLGAEQSVAVVQETEYRLKFLVRDLFKFNLRT